MKEDSGEAARTANGREGSERMWGTAQAPGLVGITEMGLPLGTCELIWGSLSLENFWQPPPVLTGQEEGRLQVLSGCTVIRTRGLPPAEHVGHCRRHRRRRRPSQASLSTPATSSAPQQSLRRAGGRQGNECDIITETPLEPPQCTFFGFVLFLSETLANFSISLKKVHGTCN